MRMATKNGDISLYTSDIRSPSSKTQFLIPNKQRRIFSSLKSVVLPELYFI